MTLSDTQSLILLHAAQHEARLAPLARIPAAARNAVFRSMLRTSLFDEVPAQPEHVGLCRRQEAAQEGTEGPLQTSVPKAQGAAPRHAQRLSRRTCKFWRAILIGGRR